MFASPIIRQCQSLQPHKRKFGFLHEEGQRLQTSERHHRRHKQSDTVLRIFLMKTYTLHVHAYLTMYQNLITHLSLSLYIYNNPKTPRDI